MVEKCADCGRFISPDEEWCEREFPVYCVTQEQYYPEYEIVCEECSDA
jgi:hypothetical protein